MNPAELMQALLDLAEDVSLEVRVVGGSNAPDGERPPASAVCRVKGRIWVVLSAAEPVDVQTGVLASALRRHRAQELEDRYLPPAIRHVLDAEAPE